MAFRGLFIGIDRFASPRIKWLTCARRDAVALHALFADTFGPGAELLTDTQATRTEIEARFQALATCDPDDVVVIAFSGHGTTTHELLTYDADPKDPATTALPLDILAEWFSRIPARRLLCILDCCFSGGMGAKVFVSDATARSADSTEVLLEQISGKGRLVLTAATANQEAWEAPRYRHGLLTYHLLRALQGVEEVTDGGKIPVFRLLEYVIRRVSDDAANFKKVQQPTLRGQIDGEFSWPIFAPGAQYQAAFPGRCTQPVTADLMSLAAHGFPPELLHAWAGSVPSLNQLQLDAINQYGLLQGEHVVVSAPTSSGKTMVGELAALRGILERNRACFLLPLKALVNDKHRQFTRLYQSFGIRVVRATGEIADDIPALMRGQYDICLLTYEKFASLAVAAPHILEQLGTIVIDEVQMIADPSRGANLEFLLTLLRMRRASGIEPQVIALSAVIGDTHGLERWLGARLLRRTARPVPLEEGVLLADGRFRYVDPSGAEQITGPIVAREFRKNSSQDWIVPLVRKLVGEGKQVIVFRQTKGDARGCAGYLAGALGLPPAQAALDALPRTDPSLASRALHEALQHGVAFHTSDLDRDERLAVEEQFRVPGSTIRVIAATTTLAMGVNTPAEAVVIAGLMHPGEQPYTVAEYKNIVGRAGRLGFADRGTSYLLALDFREEHDHWNRYVKGVPEDLYSRFVTEGTDPRTLILRVLAAARKATVKGIPAADVVDFLDGSFGAFQKRLVNERWAWDRAQLTTALRELEAHRLIEPRQDGHYHLTELGRFAGAAGVQVDSIVRLVEALRPLPAGAITDPALIVAAQLTTELDELSFPINRKSTQKEPQTWFQELNRIGAPSPLLSTLRRFVVEQHVGTMRAKKAVACLLWISDRSMTAIETALTQHGGAFDGAAGPVRAVASRTCDLLPAVARVATFLHPELDLSDRVSRLLVRLELGVQPGSVPIARHAGGRLTRGDYQELLRAGLTTPEAIEAASDDELFACLGGDENKARSAREAVTALRAEPDAVPTPILPDYEA
ncbi:DEAD/DEAH box helicase [Sorangium sp. So ce1097]|uniref:DEAD/DEAH box helicase n=1 Tax=Sorangium sp. So ce1097 TaxID=3133330 RepID=UPI003F600117